MARIRTIKPEFWTDEKVGEVSVSARLLFIACWNFADDEGGLDRSAKQLKAQAFPYDVIDCEPLVVELIDAGVLVEYEVSGRKYLHIKNFRLHQKIENPSKARIPPYESSGNNPRGLTEESHIPRPSSSGREGKGKKSGADAPASPTPKPAELELHDSLPLDAWEEWLAHRRQKRWPLDATTLRKQLNELKRHDGPTQREMIDTAINAGWQGIFPPRHSTAAAAKGGSGASHLPFAKL